MGAVAGLEFAAEGAQVSFGQVGLLLRYEMQYWNRFWGCQCHQKNSAKPPSL